MSELDDMVTALKALGSRDLAARVATKAAPLLEASLKVHLAAGESPEGKAWAPTKKGGRAYAHASEHLTVKASGNLIRAVVTGPEVYGHYGAHGIPVRRMLPDSGAEIPKDAAAAIAAGATAVLEEITR